MECRLHAHGREDRPERNWLPRRHALRARRQGQRIRERRALLQLRAVAATGLAKRECRHRRQLHRLLRRRDTVRVHRGVVVSAARLVRAETRFRLRRRAYAGGLAGTRMRLDVREALLSAAAAELEHNGMRVALIPDERLDAWAPWSEPVRMRLQVRSDDTVEILIRTIETGDHCGMTVEQACPQPGTHA